MNTPTTTAKIGRNCQLEAETIVGYKYCNDPDPAVIGDNVIIRNGTTIYADVVLHDGVQTGHDVLIREYTEIGSQTVVGTKTVIDGRSDIGENVSVQTGVYIPSNTRIENKVFLGPCAVLTNDPYPVRKNVELEGPTIKQSASIGANATLNPGITVGARSFVASGAVVTRDVPPDTLAVGVPAEFRSLPQQLQTQNDL